MTDHVSERFIPFSHMDLTPKMCFEECGHTTEILQVVLQVSCLLTGNIYLLTSSLQSSWVVSVNIFVFVWREKVGLVGSPVRSALVLFSAFETSFVTEKTPGYTMSIKAYYSIKQGVLMKNLTFPRT